MQPGPDELDREGAFLRGFAAVATSYFHCLIESGMGQGEALRLTRDWQLQYLHAMREHAARDTDR